MPEDLQDQQPNPAAAEGSEGVQAGDGQDSPTPGTQQSIDLTQLPEFRNYQATMERNLQAAKRQAEQYEQALAEVTKQLEAMQAGRQFDTDALAKLNQMFEQQQAVRSHVQALRDTWGSLGLNEQEAPDVVARLANVESPDAADQIVYEWLSERVKAASSAPERDERRQVAETGVDDSPIPASTAPVSDDDIQARAAKLRQEVQETGKSRLEDWLQLTEPVLRTRANTQARRGQQSSL